MSVRIAIKTAQSMLRSSSAPSLKVDGAWGPKSESAFVSAPDAVQKSVSVAVKEEGYDMDDIRVTKSSDTMVSPAEMKAIIDRVSSKTGVRGEVLQRFVDLEAARKVVDGTRYYVADAVNRGGYRGLFQFDALGNAWKDASKKGDLPAFSPAWKDPYTNTLAAAYYVLFNGDVLKRLGYKGEVTGSIAYLMHNQGAGGAYGIMSGKRKLSGSQSREAILVAQQAVSDYNVAMSA